MNSRSWASKEADIDTFRMQPCKSPVWDTAYAMFALGESGVSRNRSAHGEGREWMLKKQVTRQGRLGGEESERPRPPAGTSSSTTSSIPTWTTARMVLLALSKVENRNERYQHEVGAARD